MSAVPYCDHRKILDTPAHKTVVGVALIGPYLIPYQIEENE
jgi:hypothetical protein